MLEEGIRERIVGTIFECTEHHQTIAMFQSGGPFSGIQCRHSVSNPSQNSMPSPLNSHAFPEGDPTPLETLFCTVSSIVCLKKVLRTETLQ